MNHEEIFFSHIMGKAKVNTNNDVQFPEEHLHNSTTQALAPACWAAASQPIQQFDLCINHLTKKSFSVSFLNRCRKLFLAKTCCNKSAPVRERGVQIGRCFLSRCCWHSFMRQSFAFSDACHARGATRHGLVSRVRRLGMKQPQARCKQHLAF